MKKTKFYWRWQNSFFRFPILVTLLSGACLAQDAPLPSVITSGLATESTSLVSNVAIKPIRPVIDGVLPNPPPALALAQALVVNGREFRQGCEVVVRDKSTGEAFRNFKFALHHDNQFVITPNFDKSQGPWSVEVINPGGDSSGEFIFNVVAPQNLPAWFWWRSGWPWFWGCAAAGIGAVFWLLRERRGAACAQEAAADAARRKEHERMSRDFHDSVNSLSQVNLLAGKLKVIAKDQAAEIRETAGNISLAVVEAINGLEDIIWASHPENESLENLVARLRQKIGRFREFNPDLHCVLDFPLDLPEQSLSTEFNSHLLRIASETLRNIIKHAAASEVRCRLLIQGNQLQFEIADNGRGFQPEGAGTSRHGLTNLRRRAEKLGGSLVVCAKPGEGTRIFVEIPLADQSTPITAR